MSWSRTRFAGLLIVTCMPCAAGAAGPSDPRPAFAEVPAPRDTDFAIVPRSDEKHVSSAYAIEAEPAKRVDHAATGGTAKLHTALPDGPPALVIIRFDARRADDAALATSLALALDREGLATTKMPTASPTTTASVGFVFMEDEARAIAIARRLPGALGRLEPRRIDPDRVADPRPGLIEITLGGEKGTS